MSFNKEELNEHCQTILNSRRIKNKVVILCEGKILENRTERRSPALYRKLEKMPDSSFYKACVPDFWKDKPKPEFFNCGSRQNVIDTYFELLEQNEKQNFNTYLDSNKLFAFVDLDIQNLDFSEKVEHLNKTEDIFNMLYENGKTKKEVKTSIWTTGLIHKESYYFLPELQNVYNSFPKTLFKDKIFNFKDVYNEMINGIDSDQDLKSHFENVKNRVAFCSNLNLNSIQDLKISFETQVSNFNNTKEDLFALLMLTKAKPCWELISTKEKDWENNIANFKDQILLQIANFYKNDFISEYNHIYNFFKNIFEQVYNET